MARIVQTALLRLLQQLKQKDTKNRYGALFESLMKDIKIAQTELPYQLSNGVI